MMLCFLGRVIAGPKIRCFDERKDVNIPTPNIHFPRTPYAPALKTPPAASAAPQRSLLMFYAGWNYGVRMELVGIYKDDPEVRTSPGPDPEIRTTRRDALLPA